MMIPWLHKRIADSATRITLFVPGWYAVLSLVFSALNVIDGNRVTDGAAHDAPDSMLALLILLAGVYLLAMLCGLCWALRPIVHRRAIWFWAAFLGIIVHLCVSIPLIAYLYRIMSSLEEAAMHTALHPFFFYYDAWWEATAWQYTAHGLLLPVAVANLAAWQGSIFILKKLLPA